MTAALGKVVQIIFSICVWIVAFVLMIFSSVLTLLLRIFLPFPKIHSWLSAPSMGICVRLTLSRFKVLYDPELHRKRPSVYCSNHTNILDAHVACAAIPMPFCGVMDAWHFKVPGYGWMMRLARGIPVYRLRRTMLEDLVREAKTRMEEGMSILVFPEAHRTRDGRIQKFRRGVFLMAREAGYPVVPLAVRGMFDVNQRGSWLFKPGNVTVYVGRQYETAGKSDEELEALAEEIRDVIVRFVRDGEMPKQVKGEAA